MKYLKYFIVYLCLIISNIILIVLFLNLFGFLNITRGDSFFLAFIIGPIFITIYEKWKPFKLTGNLDLYIKEKFNNYFDSQKTCLNCDRVVKKDELTSDGKCVYCEKVENENNK
jgi:hypothetical protein